MNSPIYAVLAGEIAETRSKDRDQLGRIPDILRDCFSDLNRELREPQRLRYEIIRMDEFLCLTTSLQAALRSALLLACIFRVKSQQQFDAKMELRLSLGTGPAEWYRDQLRESDGTVFRRADDGLRRMKRSQRLMISTGDDRLDGEFLVICGFMDLTIQSWTDDQAEALFHKLTGKNQVEISEYLNISQPAVNRRLKAGHLEAIEKFLERYETLFA